jgi:hypothetical protein
MTSAMTDRALATSADYADALLVTRRAKNLLFLFILLMLLIQMAFFFVVRYTDMISFGGSGGVTITATTLPTTLPADTAVSGTGNVPAKRELVHYISGLTLFLGTVLPILMALVLLLIVNIMLIGRLIGVTRVTSALLWCLLLMLLMFPWQIFFGASSSPSDFRIPGVLYTWSDLRSQAKFDASNMNLAVVKWARFFVMPLVATIILLAIQIKSNRGLRQALGEETPDINITT